VRRAQAPGHTPAPVDPHLLATAPNQVLTRDIIKLQGPGKGQWYHLYVIIDIFSRYICGWTAGAESAERAEELIADTIARNGIVPDTVHAGRGTSMTSKKVSQLLLGLGVTRSHSRPKVSNDNSFSEANFKIVKYSGDCPQRFDPLAHAHHCARGSSPTTTTNTGTTASACTPRASIHFGTADLVRQQRAVTLAEVYTRHPERFARRPKPPTIPTKVWINESVREPVPAQQNR
jgi:transposase InsO family protein